MPLVGKSNVLDARRGSTRQRDLLHSFGRMIPQLALHSDNVHILDRVLPELCECHNVDGCIVDTKHPRGFQPGGPAERAAIAKRAAAVAAVKSATPRMAAAAHRRAAAAVAAASKAGAADMVLDEEGNILDDAPMPFATNALAPPDASPSAPLAEASAINPFASHAVGDEELLEMAGF
jgi:hypothetical protein